MNNDDDPLLTPGEVAKMFRVHAKTVTRWAKQKRLASIRTPGGHRRFRESDVRAALRRDEGGESDEDRESDEERDARAERQDEVRRAARYSE